MIRPIRVAGMALIALLAAGCGGGGGGSSTSPVTAANAGGSAGSGSGNGTGGANSTVHSGSAILSLSIPATSTTTASNKRRVAYVSSATQSVAVFAYLATATPPATATTVVNVGASSPGCTTGASAISCTITVPAQYGSMTFIVKTYDNVLATGNLLSQATITATIGANQAPIPLVLSGVVAGVTLSLASVTVPAGGGTTTLNVNALDPNGATIVGSGTYGVPIVLSANDKTVTFSPATVTGPGQPVTVTYTAATSAQVTINASATGVAPNAITQALLAVSGTGPANGTAYAIDEASDALVGFPAGANANVAPTVRYTTGANLSWGALASDSSGDVAAATYLGSGQTIYIFNGPTSSTPARTIVTQPSESYTYGLAFDASGNLYTASSSGILVYAAGASGAAPPARSITSSAMTNPLAVGVDTAGDIYELELSGSVVNKFASTANGASGPVAQITPSLTGMQTIENMAVSGDGYVALDVFDPSTYSNKILVYSSSGTLARTITSSVLAGYSGAALGFASNDDLYVTAANVVYVFPSTLNGNVMPTRGFGGTATAGYFLGSVSIGSAQAAPSATKVTGDMLALAASKTWNYTVTPNSSYDCCGSQYTTTVYSDPQAVDGASSLVAFVSTTLSADALPADGGTLAAAIGVTSGSDGYHAQTFGSVSNDSFGAIPGAPLLVPASLTLGQTFVPYPGITATVSQVGAVPGISACPNAPAAGATVVYSIATLTETVSYVPGCGITDYVSDSGSDFRLASVGSHPEVGEQSIARRTLAANMLDTLHTIWQRTFVKH